MTRILMLDVETPLSDPEAEIVCRIPHGIPGDLSSPADWSLAGIWVMARFERRRIVAGDQASQNLTRSDTP